MDHPEYTAHVPQPASNEPSLYLPSFWTSTPFSWFAYAENYFCLHGINTEDLRCDYLVGALSKDSMRTVLDILMKHTDTPYSDLKSRLLASHGVTPFQRIDRLFHMEPMGERKPSELLSEMIEICPQGEEKSIFFRFLFLQCLPKDLWVLLGEDVKSGHQDLAAKADKLWAKQSHLRQSIIVTVQSKENPSLVQKGEILGIKLTNG
jgi:hypothetical protein